MEKQGKIIHKLTIDLEPWHWTTFKSSKAVNEIDYQLVRRQTNELLNCLEENKIEATFFVVGNILKNCPDLIERIASDSHQIGLHSFAHIPIYAQSPDEFKYDLQSCFDYYKQIIGSEPLLFRAPGFSIRLDTIWAINVLSEFGIKYDSSVHKVHFHPSYGNKFNFSIQEFEKYGITEFPVSVLTLSNINIPFAGGAYFRYYPYKMIEFIFRRFEEKKEEITFYFHQWEFSDDLPDLNFGFIDNLRRTYGIQRNIEKFRKLTSDFEFSKLIN